MSLIFQVCSKRYKSTASLSNSKIFTLSDKNEIRSQFSSEPLFMKAWLSDENIDPRNDPLNSFDSLPIPMLSKADLFHKAATENPQKASYSLTFKQYFEYGKSFIKFYKTGLVNVYHNKKAVNKIFREDLMIPSRIDNRGNERNIRIRNFETLTHEMSSAIYLSKIEEEKSSRNDRRNVFNITRSQYQVVKRTKVDFVKLPFFALLFLVFEEMTPILCYLFPEITPSSCVLPGILPRLMKTATKSSDALCDYRRSNYGISEQTTMKELERIANKTAYNLPLEEVKLLVKSLNLVTKYIPVQLYPESYLRNKLRKHYNYLIVDNYLILNNGGIWNLSRPELILACFERGLIVLTSSKFNYDFDELRLKLIIFMVNLEKFDVGYIGTQNLNPNFLRAEDVPDLLTVRQKHIQKIK